MKESTIHITAEFTFIRQHTEDVSFELDSFHIADSLKAATGADDVLITKAKVFESEPHTKRKKGEI